jgi:hypothetical protein
VEVEDSHADKLKGVIYKILLKAGKNITAEEVNAHFQKAGETYMDSTESEYEEKKSRQGADGSRL